jgi:methyl-accepting chemotaxis protein
VRYSQPLTGNLAHDLVNNRTKRIFNDRTGIAAARSKAPYFIQRYQRDTGEVMADRSVPVVVRGEHWGAVRLGYRAVDAR